MKAFLFPTVAFFLQRFVPFPSRTFTSRSGVAGTMSPARSRLLVAGALAALALAGRAQAAVNLTTIHEFSVTRTGTALVRGSDGDFYGVSGGGGSYGFGTTFKVTTAGAVTTLHSFGSTAGEGAVPVAAFVLGKDGNFYGMTQVGGAHNDGAVFKMTAAGAVTTLHSFDYTDGAFPQAALIQAKDGNFYGLTYGGGAHGDGAAFKITAAGALSVLHGFGSSDTDGDTPQGGLIQAADGNFYGATYYGGTKGYGTVFKLTAAGALTILHSFDNTDGYGPDCSLVEGSTGTFYGTTYAGGSNGMGTVFKITSAGALTTLHTFGGAGGGAYVQSALIKGSDGNFYGTTNYGGANAAGTAYRITPAGTLGVLHSFGGTATDGSLPAAALVQGTDGNFYGTTYRGGSGAQGVIYKLTPGGTATTLHAFSDPTGIAPAAAVLQGSDGNFYGTTPTGGTAGHGTVFKSTAAGALTTLHSFAGVPSEGNAPQAPLIRGSDGNFYGTTFYGGAHDNGTVFKITAAGALTTLHSFNLTDGSSPATALLQGSDGNFYGTAGAGGTDSLGTVFKLTPAGALTTLHNFTGSGADGYAPGAALALGTDGNFYGTTTGGGKSGFGSIFRITPAGVVAALHNFGGPTDGSSPSALTRGKDGNFYGVTFTGATGGNGTIFKVTPAGTLTTLHKFGGADGANPEAALLQAADGNFYSTASAGGSDGMGTIFRITPAGAFTSLLSFDDSNGASPTAALIQTADGNFYGTAAAGGSNSGGTIFRLSIVSSPVITSATSATATAGQAFSYQITASNTPTSYGESGIPAGLSINQSTGKISGTPTKAGTYSVTIAAFNSAGSGSAKLTLTVKAAVAKPVITSSLNPPSRQGVPFSYQITATNNPASYGESGIPAGLSINQATGKITGTPTKQGTYTVTIAAFNSGGSGSAKLTLVVKPPA